MTQTVDELRLSRIDTLWTVVCQAKDPDGAVRAAQQRMLERYGGAVRRYLLAATRDEDAADELCQEFAVRFLRGGLRGASQDRGRFRDYLKGVLIHLVANYHHGRKKGLLQLDDRHPEPVDDSPAEQERAFLAGWRDELLARAWAALEGQERAHGQPFHTVLRYRAEYLNLSSQEMAAGLQELLGKPLTAAAVRQTLHRARDRFAELLLDEIAATLREPTAAYLEEELTDLGLLEHCRPALRRRLGPT
jgi:RNA polymerase sigma-70 factor (ECF subfamily)